MYRFISNYQIQTYKHYLRRVRVQARVHTKTTKARDIPVNDLP